ncbi:MAG: hypothetical protein ACC631_03355, partial [Halocynthiibacter sp.]
MKETLTRDHAGLSDALVARRYFSKFETITGHLGRVAALMRDEGAFSKAEMMVMARYLGGISKTFQALANKYLLTGRVTG